MKIYVYLFCIFFFACEEKKNIDNKKQSQENQFSVAFGSCNKQYKPQPLWPVIASNNPNLWIWLGDVIYADTENMEIMSEKYNQQLTKKEYQSFKSKIPIIGTWDDHDYGENNAGKKYLQKEKSQKLFLDFLGEPQDSLRRKQKGIYWAYNYEISPSLRMKILILDTRYHRDDPGKKADILGKKQWKWLEAELKNSNAEINIICSSIQIISNKHRFEKWANFPMARKRLFDLIRITKAKGVIFLSGDRHFSEISKIDEITFYPIYEITCSGMTHNAFVPITLMRDENKKYRVTDCFKRKNFGQLVINEQKKMIFFEIRNKKNMLKLEKMIPFSSVGINHEE